jgi:hypothetical protein
MAKNKISEYSATASNNTDIGGINIAEGCAPSGINNAIRELMAQLKDQQTGADADNFVVGGAFTCSGAAVFSSTVALGASATATTPSNGDSSTKVATTAFVSTAVSGGVPSGCILMWSGTIATIPSGWKLCNGSNGTPDLRNKFIIGAFSDTSGVAYSTITGSNTQTGGTKDLIAVSHTHTIGAHSHGGVLRNPADGLPHRVTTNRSQSSGSDDALGDNTNGTSTDAVGLTTNSAGSSGTNQNLPPYYALAYIMKS